MLFRIDVFATIADEHGRVLLCHRTDCDYWNQPGGGLESGETPWDGVVREVREETGLAVVVDRLAGVYSWAGTKDEIIFSFICRVVAGTPAPSDEADDVRYFPLAALPPNTFPEHATRMRDALGGATQTLLRVPTGPPSSALAERSCGAHQARRCGTRCGGTRGGECGDGVRRCGMGPSGSLKA